MRSRLFSTVAGPKYSTRDGRSSIGGRAHFQSDENHPDAVFSSNGKRIGFQINLRSARDNVIDEENGISRSTLATGLESYRSKRVAPEKFRDYRDGAEQTLQVIQTKHISEEEGQDTVILTVTENVKANIGEDTSCDIRWM